MNPALNKSMNQELKHMLAIVETMDESIQTFPQMCKYLEGA